MRSGLADDEFKKYLKVYDASGALKKRTTGTSDVTIRRERHNAVSALNNAAMLGHREAMELLKTLLMTMSPRDKERFFKDPPE